MILSVVYAGGDDLFIIGHWLDAMEAAFDINRYFHKFTGNDFVTISGGLAIEHEKFPVYQFAKLAEKAEDTAKKKDDKNAITLFPERAFGWSEPNGADKVAERILFFIKFLKKQDDHFIVDEGKLPKTFFYRLLILARRYLEEEKEKGEGVIVLPKAAYLFSKVRKSKNINDEDKLQLEEVVMFKNKDDCSITEAATMWILMMMRKPEKKGGAEDAGR